MDTQYPAGQLAKALTTAETHADPATRDRAGRRAQKWRAVLSGMARGRLTIGSRTPVAGLPAWATPEVAHGGFATGSAVAAGPLTAYEQELVRRHGLPSSRSALFAHFLGDEGLAELTAMLDSGRFRVDVPEESALLIVAWLARAGDSDAALDLLDVLRPFADRLRFAPSPGAGGRSPAASPEPVARVSSSLFWRQTAGEVASSLRRREPNPRIESQRETLRVWNPFADKLLTLWLESPPSAPEDSWTSRARAAVADHQELATAYPPSKRHGGPKANVTVLVTALDARLNGRPWAAGLVRTVVDGMVRKRGLPGSPAHAALRSWQAEVASRPGYHEIAAGMAAELSTLPPDAGTTEIDAVLPPSVPPALERVARRATAGTLEELLAAGLVPSAEVLAGFVPRLTAQSVAAPYPSADLRGVVTATYLAFRKRRTLLLTNLESQVRLDELPWMRAAASRRSYDADSQRGATDALAQIGSLALASFPATLLPNPLVRELATLSREAGLGLSWVEELAADIFDGRFVAKYLAAAQLAGELLAGTLYERYYGIDYAAIARFTAPWKVAGTFGEMCRSRAGDRRGSVAANGMVIEQAQILTTHNLATLVHGAGVTVPGDAAAGCFRVASRLARSLGGPHANRTVKDIAYAWRQMIFFLSVPGPVTNPVTGSATGDAATFIRGLPTTGRLGPAVAGLRAALDGRPARPLTGWALGRHWLLPMEKG